MSSSAKNADKTKQQLERRVSFSKSPAANASVQQKLLKRSEVEDWFSSNMKQAEAKKNMAFKEMIRSKTSYRENMIKHNAKLNQVDPIFCRAFDVAYDEKRGKEIRMTSAKIEELDEEF